MTAWPDDPDELLAVAASQLVEAVDAAIEGWAQRCLLTRAPQLRDEAVAASRACRSEVRAALTALVESDIDEQRATPLQIVRLSAGRLARVLADAGIAPPPPAASLSGVGADDAYALGPASWADLGDEVNEAGLRWGAAKAMVHLRRRNGPSG